MVNCGCYDDTISNFKSKVRDVHHDTIYEIQYNNAIEFAKKLFSINRKNICES